MKRISLTAAAAAALLLAGCNQGQNQDKTPPVANESVTITQATPPPGGNWSDVVNQTTDGFVMGNPNAAVKLVEIASLGCPFCRKFEEEGATRLVEDYVKSGKVSWEFRPFLIHGSIDLAANLVARCNGPTTFFPLMQAMYKDQPVWMAKIQAVPQARLEEVQNLPTNQIFVQIAKLVGFQDWAAARGVPQVKVNQCLADQAMIDHEVQVTSDVGNQYPDFKGTPSFILNGKLLPETNDWAKLKPQLDAAVK
jgi:protein-disulfide isomerase